jgi:Rrf2 family protein
MRLSARVDYALRAAAELAARPDEARTVDALAAAQQIPAKYLESILGELRRAGLLRSQRGPDGGYRLARPADEIAIADIIRVLDGPLANVRGERPELLEYTGAAEPLQQVWIALRASERAILDEVTLANIASGQMPPRVRGLVGDRASWSKRPGHDR